MSIGVYIIVVAQLCYSNSKNRPQFTMCINQMSECINKDTAHLSKVSWCEKNVEYFK